MPRSSLSPVSSNLPDVAERRALQLLVVDDDATQRSLITVAAKQAGHEVTVAPSVAEAIEKLRAARFDCVTLDLVLEDGDGIDVLREMAEAKFAGAVIVISGMRLRSAFPASPPNGSPSPAAARRPMRCSRAASTSSTPAPAICCCCGIAPAAA